MKKELAKQPEIKLVGLTVRTNNQDEINPTLGKIGPLARLYGERHIANTIPNRKHPGVTIAAYTDYASNEHGDYSYFIGEEVTSFEQIPPSLQILTIPAATYQKFTTPYGKMPDVVYQAWLEIWKMSPADLGGKRTYQTDFEVYADRATDFTNLSLDIYIGIN